MERESGPVWTNGTQLPSLGNYDVIVVGSGSAGSPAAIAASRQGAKTLLLERLPFLGGNSTAVLDTFYGFYTPGTKSLEIVGGLPIEVRQRLAAYDAVLERPNTYGAGANTDHDLQNGQRRRSTPNATAKRRVSRPDGRGR